MSYRDYLRRQSETALEGIDMVLVDSRTGELLDDEFAPAVPLSEQVHSLHNGGLPLHPMGEAVYDEDDVSGVDPANRYGLDRFEYQTAVEQAAFRAHKNARDLKAKPSTPPSSDPPSSAPQV